MVNESFQWERQPKAEAVVLGAIETCCRQNEFIARLEHFLHELTSTRLLDWADHVILGHSEELDSELTEAGFISDVASTSYRVFHHPGAQLPRIVVKDHDQPVVGLAIAADSIADFLMVHQLSTKIEGSLLSGYRRSCVASDDVSLWVVERRGTLTMEPTHTDDAHAAKYLHACELWQSRPRDLHNDGEAMNRTIALAQELVDMMGQDMAAWIVLECERRYWEARNHAGQVQKDRQDRLGLGWANHDHHTFRSSRRHFVKLVRVFEILGFHCRERFYAGEDAGWGAQVMENSNCGLVLFLDVDLDPHEVAVDFAHHELPELDKLGTIGLWCELHGDSILKAGMHHLEAQFNFTDLTEDLAEMGIGMMEPFSNFDYLKQAFTSGEVWAVDERRVRMLQDRGMITAEQADKFRHYGAVGSHLENLQRREGYKGFNKKNVSFIIKKTDPRSLEV
ncbi:MAG: hypothetical protein H7A37_08520 [Chlamydiales bacterium]|nr:hypothetical protein [Chlamydiia bacterium]MCP5508322.1 hypothetical protein [Chlamydiales bacterium]